MSSNGLTQPPATAMQRNLAMHNSAVESGSRRKDTDEWLGSRRSRMLDWRQPPSATPTFGDNIGDNLPLLLPPLETTLETTSHHRISIGLLSTHRLVTTKWVSTAPVFIAFNATTNTDNILCSVLKRRVLCKLNFSYFLVD